MMVHYFWDCLAQPWVADLNDLRLTTEQKKLAGIKIYSSLGDLIAIFPPKRRLSEDEARVLRENLGLDISKYKGRQTESLS